MKRTITIIVALLAPLVLANTGLNAVLNAAQLAEEQPYEVWVMDQSDTTPDGGGTLYIYRGADLEGYNAGRAAPEVIDLGGAARSLCLAQTGTAPRRPHMSHFNFEHTHAIIAFVATGHVLLMDASTRAPIACIDAGVQAHAAMPSHDQTHIVVANQNGKLLQRINTNYATNTFTLDNAATLDLANCTTPNGAPCQDANIRPDNAPICPILDSASRLTFVTLRGGGMFVINSRSTPMSIVGEYDRNTVHPNGCGGVEHEGLMYINAGGGVAANPLESDLYSFPLGGFSHNPNPPNTPAPTLVFSHDERGFVDGHGVALLAPRNHHRNLLAEVDLPDSRRPYLWVADRAANLVTVVNAANRSVENEFSLVGNLSADPAPDLMDVSPTGNRVFITLRGPNPLTGNVPGINNAVGATPGLGIIRVEQGGRLGVLQTIAPITHIVNGIETADPHGIMVRHR